MNTIVYFDMDETLFTHEGVNVHIVLDSKRIKTLSNVEFNNYKLLKNESYDFSDFISVNVFEKSAIPINYMIKKLNCISNKYNKVEILTARSDMDDKEKFAGILLKHGIDISKIHFRRAGNTQIEHKMNPAEAKRHIIDLAIDKYKYNSIHLYDDSEKNLEMFLTLKEKHPDVIFNAHHVIYNKINNNTEIILKKV